jgi:Ca2+-binding RTX toxin-like protein
VSDGGAGTSGDDYFALTANGMVGGLGDDVYIVNGSSGAVTEGLNHGTDTVVSSVSYTLGANVENLVLTTVGKVGTGNDLANQFVGTSGSDTFVGLGGDDLYYAEQNDTISEAVGGGVDTVVSLKGYSLAYMESRGQANVENVTLGGTTAIVAIGNDGDNKLVGNSADNFINGRGGADEMDGGDGNDLYIVDNAGDRITEIGVASLHNNIDTLWASVSYDMSTNATHVENAGLYGNSNLTIIGNDLNNIYYIDDATNQVVELNSNGGTDTVVSSVDFTLGSNLENLTLTATGHIGTGNDLANVMRGTSGSDTLAGMGGDDIYYAEHNDTIIEAAGGGVDTIISYNGFSLAFKGYDNIENITLLGGANANAIGNDTQNNVLVGNAGNNFLNGKGGNDRLEGGYGNDQLLGGDSVGGYIGVNGADTFVFNTVLNARSNVDTIYDFNAASGDKIELSTAIFSSIAHGSTTAMTDGYIVQSSGSLYYDADAGGTGSAILFANLANGAVLTDADFSVV